MLTKRDIQLLKDVFATKDDLKHFATKTDVLHLREELATQKKDIIRDIIDEVKIMLDRQTRDIHADIGQLLVESINPLLDHHDTRISRLEKHAKLPPMPFVSTT